MGWSCLWFVGRDEFIFYLVEKGRDQPIFCLVLGLQKWDELLTYRAHIHQIFFFSLFFFSFFFFLIYFFLPPFPCFFLHMHASSSSSSQARSAASAGRSWPSPARRRRGRCSLAPSPARQQPKVTRGGGGPDLGCALARAAAAS